MLFTENETIRTLLGGQLKELHNTDQSISDLSRLSDKLARKGNGYSFCCEVILTIHTASSSKAEYEMLGNGIDDLENEAKLLDEKKRVLVETHKSTTAKLSLENAKLAETVSAWA